MPAVTQGCCCTQRLRTAGKAGTAADRDVPTLQLRQPPTEQGRGDKAVPLHRYLLYETVPRELPLPPKSNTAPATVHA
jgi:hypothetical protein